MNIYSMAANIDKPRKSDIQDTIEQIFRDLPKEASSLERLRLAGMYKYFMPPLPKIANDPIEWVSKARSKDKTRYYITQNYSTGTHLCATDGNRLHRIKTDLPKGYYDEKGNALDFDGTFPDVERLFFDTSESSLLTLDIKKAEIKKRGKLYYYLFTINDQKVAFDKKLIDEAFNGTTTLNGYVSDEKYIQASPFQSDEGTIMLMPLRYGTL